MSVKSAIRMVLAKRNLNQADLGRLWNGSNKAVPNKFNRDTWTAADLVKIARLMDCHLMFVFPDGQQIPITEDDPEFTPPTEYPTGGRETPLTFTNNGKSDTGM